MGDQVDDDKNLRRPLDYDDLRRRVEAFNRLELPGQPRAMHIGTSYLISDMWRLITELREKVARLERDR